MEEKLRNFILEHSADDTDKLLLGSNKWPEVDVKCAVNCIISRRKLNGKVQEWYDCTSLLYPNTLSAEQCSSSATAKFKASVVLSAVSPADAPANADCRLVRQSVADLTGGLGVDSWAFAKAGAKVLYNEMDPSIYASALHNFKELGLSASEDRDKSSDIICRNFELKSDNIDEILEGFEPDVIFLDPARRSGSGSKVFRLEDCSPNLLIVAGPLLDRAPRLVAKLSPMADITLLQRQLATIGIHIRKTYIIGSGGECKELLLVMEHAGQSSSEMDMEIVEFHKNDESEPSRLRFHTKDEKTSSPVFVPTVEGLAGCTLFEPGKTMMKAGIYNLPCTIGFQKLGASTHLYVYTAGQGQVCEDGSKLLAFGKTFMIKEVHPLDKHSLKSVGKSYPRSEVTARNIPMTSDELRKRLGVKSGDDAHIFGVRCDFSLSQSANLLLVCSPVM